MSAIATAAKFKTTGASRGLDEQPGQAESRLTACGRRSPDGLRGSAVLVPATRRQEASKFGQACCEQSRPTARMSSRSALASACGTLASTCGAKPGRTVRAAATNAAMAMAERALIMTVPCHWAFSARRFVGGCDTQRPFPDVFARRGKWFRPAGVLFRRQLGDETMPVCIGDAPTPQVVQWPAEIKNRLCGRGREPARLAGPPGAG